MHAHEELRQVGIVNPPGVVLEDLIVGGPMVVEPADLVPDVVG